MDRGRNQRNGRGRGGDNRGGGRGGRGEYRRHRSRRPMDKTQSAESGNMRERIALESGALVLIDQFMLANPQFIEKIASVSDEAIEAKDTVVKSFGGLIVELTPGNYRIERDPFAASIVIVEKSDERQTAEVLGGELAEAGMVNIDTRCIAMFDRELLDDSELLGRYRDLWFEGQEKACRDLLRDNGGAVRYGFNRLGDDLVVTKNEGLTAVSVKPRAEAVAA